METISLKIDGDMLTIVDSTLKKHNFGTRTEFIRTAIREKLVSLDREHALREFLTLRGISSDHDEKLHDIRDRVVRSLFQEP